ncbi:MAG: undecaprenyl-diphosphate phosphatase [Pseudomonadota bacterium]
MDLIQLIILAIIQGVTEFLPVSSSGHLILAPALIEGWQDQGPLIDVAAHVGSLFAVLIYFRKETRALTAGGLDVVRRRETPERRLFLLIAASTLPFLLIAPVVVKAGLVDLMRNPTVIGWAFIIGGIFLFIADRRPEAKAGLDGFSWADAFLIGAAQCFAVIPGASRSGVTMTAARFLGFERSEAARFSMLMAIPTILMLGGYAFLEILSEGDTAKLADALLVALLSFLFAWAAIAALMRLTRSISFDAFVFYRVVLGAILVFSPLSG